MQIVFIMRYTIIGIIGYRKRLNDFYSNLNNNATSIIKRERQEEIFLKINSLLEEDKIFLKKDLRLDEIAKPAQANRTYISILISEKYQYTFSELINRKRIEYAQNLVVKNPNLSQAQLAEETGFSHASSFSRTFKQYTGITFREWYNK